MPYVNEHACRLGDPSQYTNWARIDRPSRSRNGKVYNVIRGQKGDGEWDDQAFRYPKATWSVAEARRHCSAHGGIEFEPARPAAESRFVRLESYQVRYELLAGKMHVVVPVVALAEGVHIGMDMQPVYFPAEEIAKQPASWNGVPVTLFHPTGEHGDPASANSPTEAERRTIGRFFSSTFDANGNKLRGELWIDEQRAFELSPALLGALKAGRPVEVSASMFTKDEFVTGSWRTEPYVAIAREYRPDHIAVLPGHVGACSYADGCGVRANADDVDDTSEGDETMKSNVRGSARSPSYEGTESTSWTTVKKTFAAFRDAYYEAHGGAPDEPVSRIQDAPAAMRRWIASKTLLGDPDADNERDILFFPVVNPNTGKLNEGALKAVLGGRGAQANIPDEAKTSAQKKARSLLEKEFGMEPRGNAGGIAGVVGRVIADTLRGLGLRIHDGDDELAANEAEMGHDELRSQLQQAVDALDNPGWHHFVREVFDDHFIYEAFGTNPSETLSVVRVSKLYKRGYTVQDNGAVSLSGDPTEVIKKTEYVPLNAGAARANTAPGEADIGKDTQMEKKLALIKALIACPCTRFAETDREWLSSLSEQQLEKLQATDEAVKAMTAAPSPPAAQTTAAAAPAAATAVPPPEPAPKETKPTSLADYLASAPPEIAQTLQRALTAEQAHREQMVKEVMQVQGNVFTEQRLMTMPLDDLRGLLSLAGRAASTLPAYMLAAGAPASNPRSHTAKPAPSLYDKPAGQADTK